MLRTIDDFIFERFPAIERIAQWIEYFTLATPNTQARVVLIFGSAIHCAIAWQILYTTDDLSLWKTIAMQGFLVILMLTNAQMCEHKTSRGKSKNWLREHPVVLTLRTLMLLTTIAGFYFTIAQQALWKSIGPSSVCLTYYLLACDARPPGDHFWSKFRKRALA